MDQKLITSLHWHGLTETRVGDARWIGMHPRLADLYMTALAEAMARKVGARPITDESFDHAALSAITIDRLAAMLLDDRDLADPARSDDEIEATMACIAFRYVLPKDPASIPAQKIIDFRNDHREERDHFHTAVRSIVNDLAYLKEVGDPRVVERHLEDKFAATLQPRLDRLRAQLNANGIATIESVMDAKATLPTLVGSGIGALGLTLAEPVTATAGLALSLWSVWRKHREDDGKELASSDVSYLYSMERELRPRELLKRIHDDSKYFTPTMM